MEHTRTITREFETGAKAVLHAEVRSGAVMVEPHEHDRVHVEAVVHVWSDLAVEADEAASLVARGIEQEFLPMAKEFGISTVVYNPLAGGLLTGKQRRDSPIAGSRFDNNQLYLDRYWRPAYFDAVEELRKVAEDAGRSLVSLSLGWLLHHTQADCLILGASRIDQLEENLKAAGEGPLPPDAVAACDAVWNKLRGVTPKYNR